MTGSSQATRVIQALDPLAAKPGGEASKELMSDLMKKAESAVSNLANEYLAWVQGDLKTLEKLVVDMEGNGRHAAELAGRAHDILHDMKGNGSTFGYDLVTAIAQSACDLTRARATIEPERREVLRHHVAALRLVIDKGITGPGGEPGKRLVDRLHALAAPFRAAPFRRD